MLPVEVKENSPTTQMSGCPDLHDEILTMLMMMPMTIFKLTSPLHNKQVINIVEVDIKPLDVSRVRSRLN